MSPQYTPPLVKSSVETIDDKTVKLSVEVDENEFESAIEQAFRRIAKEVRLPGFRPGKAPRRVLEARIGQQAGREEALRESLPEYYAEAVRDHEVDVIAPPEIDITSGQTEGPVSFDAVVEVRPQIEISGYGGLRATIPKPRPDEDEIAEQIDRIREQYAELEKADRPAIDGDSVLVDITTTQDGEELEGLTAQDYLYEVGSGAVVPELDENLRGATAGDILEFTAAHPEDDDAELSFRLLVKEVQANVLPELDDEWVKEASDGEHETVESLRGAVVTRLTNMRISQANFALRERTSEALAELVDIEVPAPLVEHEIDNQIQNLLMRLRSQGMDPEQWLQATGQNRESLAAMFREQAVTAAKVDLALRAVAVAEEIEVTDEDLDEQFGPVAAQTGRQVADVRAEFERAGHLPAVRSDVRKSKALDWLVERVEIVDEDENPVDRADLEPLAGEADEDAVAAPSEAVAEENETAEGDAAEQVPSSEEDNA